MNITIPFLKDIIKQAVHKQSLSKLSSFDLKAPNKHISAVRKMSSLSDSEFSEANSVISNLMTRSGVEEILDVDSTITRYILMLDVWLSQV